MVGYSERGDCNGLYRIAFGYERLQNVPTCRTHRQKRAAIGATYSNRRNRSRFENWDCFESQATGLRRSREEREKVPGSSVIRRKALTEHMAAVKRIHFGISICHASGVALFASCK